MFLSVQGNNVATESAVWGISKWDAAKWSDETKSVPTESFLLGTSRLGHAKLSDGSLYGQLLSLLNQKKPRELDNNRKDALIGETCIKNRYMLVSNDRALGESVEHLRGNAVCLNEFLTA